MTRTLLVALLTLGDPGRLTGGYLYQRRVADLAPRHGVRVLFLSLPDRPFPLPVLDAPLALRRARTLGADVLVLDSIVAAFFGPWLALGATGRPLLGMLHQPPGGMEHGSLRTAVQRRLDLLAYRRAGMLLVPSRSLADEVVAVGLTHVPIRVVPPGHDLGHRSNEHLRPDPYLRQGRRAAFLCVANWLPRKGVDFLLEAFAGLPSDAATLHLVGDPHADRGFEERLRRRLARPDLAGRVVVHGSRSPEEVAAFYQACDAFVLPSFVEPYGMVYAEAMAAGLPVVGWRAGNLPYLVDHDREGLLVDPRDTPGLAAALRRLVDDPDLRRRLGGAARRRARAFPNWEDTAAAFCEAVRELGQRGGAARSPLSLGAGPHA